jgi:hypothetical protein
LRHLRRAIVPSETNNVRFAFVLEPGGEAYVASFRVSGAGEALASVRLVREIVDLTVLEGAQLEVEVGLDGSVAAYAQTADRRTLTRAPLSQLVAEALAPDLLAAEDDLSELAKLEAELERALALVRTVRTTCDRA